MAHFQASPLRDFLKAPRDRSSPGEQVSVESVKIVIRGKEHESAGNAHCDPDNTSIELDGKTLRRHNSSPDERRIRAVVLSAQLQTARLLKLQESARCKAERGS
jgi:hypothetical protein